MSMVAAGMAVDIDGRYVEEGDTDSVGRTAGVTFKRLMHGLQK